MAARRAALGAHPRSRDDLGGHAGCAVCDGARLVEQQGVAVTRGLHRPARGGEDVELQQPIHAGDAYGGKQASDGGGDRGR